MDNPCSGMVND